MGIIFENNMKEIDLVLLNAIIFELKKHLNEVNNEALKIDYNYSKYLKEYTREDITDSLRNIFESVSIIKNNEKERFIIDIKFKQDVPEVTIGFFNVLYLKENFFTQQ